MTLAVSLSEVSLSEEDVATRLGRGGITVPVTIDTTRVLRLQTQLPAEVTGLREDSKAQAEQVRSIALERVGAVLGRLPCDVMAQLDVALRLHLRLSGPNPARDASH